MSETSAPRAEVLRTRDFMGWPVAGRDGASVGTVSDILIDRRGQVRFLAVDRGLFKKHVLVPVEMLEWGDGSLVVGWSDAEVRGLPPYDPAVPLNRGALDELARAYPRYYRTGGPPPPPLSTEGHRVVPIKEAKDFRLAKGAPNLHGWTVYGNDNEKVGAVSGMLVDPVAMKVRYLDVDVDDDLFALTDDRHVLVPMEAVELRERSEDAWVTRIDSRSIAALPAYTGGAADPLVEEEVARAFGGGAGNGLFQPAREPAALPAGYDGEPGPDDSPPPPRDEDEPVRLEADEPPPPPPASDEPPPPPPGSDEPPPLPPDSRRPPIIVEDGPAPGDDERGSSGGR